MIRFSTKMVFICLFYTRNIYIRLGYIICNKKINIECTCAYSTKWNREKCFIKQLTILIRCPIALAGRFLLNLARTEPVVPWDRSSHFTPDSPHFCFPALFARNRCLILCLQRCTMISKCTLNTMFTTLTQH